MDLHIFIYNEIGEYGTTADEVQKQIVNNTDCDNIIVHISSPGGEVFEGWTIGNILKNSNKPVTVLIEGLCASIATYIALQGNTIKMAETARFMVHNPKTGVMGESKDLENAVKQLDSIKGDLVKSYKKKTGINDKELSDMMDNETWLTPNEALAAGFIDEIIAPSKAVAYLNTNNNIMDKPEETPKVAEKSKLEEKFDTMMNALNKLVGATNEAEEVTNMALELADGKMIFVQSEDGELEGKPVFMADEEGNPTEEAAPDGTHALNDGRSITVEDGMVVSVQEAEPEDAEKKQMEEEIANLKAQLETVTNEKETLTNEFTEFKDNVTNLQSEMAEIKNTIVGGAPIAKAVIKPENKSVEKPEAQNGLGAWGASFLTKNK